MREKVLISFLLIALLDLASCLGGEEVLEITSIEIETIDGNWDRVMKFDMSSGIHFRLNTDERVISYKSTSSYELVAFGIDPDIYVRYPIDSNSLELIPNAPILLDKDTLKASKNMLANPDVRLNTYYWQTSSNGTMVFGLKDEITKRLKSTTLDYQFIVKCETLDGRKFEDDVRVEVVLP